MLDHTNLEIARINYITSIDARMGMTGQELRTKYDEIRKIASEIEPKVEDLSKKANSSYSEFISILGIFSAVVLVYFGGTTILGNVLTTMNKTFILKSVAVSLIVGIIVLNIIFVFIYFLSKILGRSIASGDEEYWYSNIFIKVKEKYPIIYYVNAFFVLFLILDVMLWIMYYLNGYCDFTQFIFNYVSKGNARTKAIFALLGLLIIIDAVFIIYYISGKILKERTGNIIDLKYSVFSPLYRDTDNDCRYTFDESGNRKDFKERKDVIGYYFRKRSNEFYVKIVNFKRRLFNRYPRILWFNIVILVVIFIISVNL